MPEELVDAEGARKEKSYRVRGSLPKKTRVNLAKVTRIRKHYEIPVILTVAAALGIYFFSEYGVRQRFLELNAARERLASVKSQVIEAESTLDQYGEYKDLYAHLTWSGISAGETSVMDPYEVLETLERVILPINPMDNLSLMQRSLTLTITASSVEELNETVRRIEADPMVSYCILSNRRRAMSQNGGERSDSVTGQVFIQLKGNDYRQRNTTPQIDAADAEG